MARTNLSDLYYVLDERESLIRSFDPEEFGDTESDLTLAHDHYPFAEHLNRSLRELEGEETEYRALRDALFQEWVFLQEMSWIGSATRAAFRTMVHAGSWCVELGKRTASKEIRRTRHKSPDDPITKLDVLMTSFKWTAVEGATFSAPLFGVPPIWAAAAGFVTNKGFALIDP